MTVLLVLITFVAFIAIDWFMNRGRVLATAPGAREAAADAAIEGVPHAGGYAIPDQVRYHPGHTWLFRERKNVNRVGIDSFAAALTAGAEKVDLPKPGHWIRQGQKIITLHRHGGKAELVSPVEGEVVEVNTEAAANPAVLRDDPYGRGWLLTVFTPDEDGPKRNLLPASLVPSWMRESADRLFALQPAPAGATAADGGVAMRDTAAVLSDEQWQAAVRELFLS